MKILFSLMSCCLIIISSCKKSSTETTIPPGNPNNEMNATVSVNGGAASSFTATGNSTTFGRRIDPNGDSVIYIDGDGGGDDALITIVNTHSAGSCPFETNHTTTHCA